MSKPFIRNAVQGDVSALAATMREEDRLELLHFSRTAPRTELQRAFDNGETFTIEWNGKPIAMFGVVPDLDAGRPWLLGTDDTKRVFSLHRDAQAVLAGFLSQYDTLVNFVWAGNTSHVRWLKWLGFEFTSEHVINGETFLLFSMTNTTTKEAEACGQ